MPTYNNTTPYSTMSDFWASRGTDNKFNPFGTGSISSKNANTATWTSPVGTTVEFTQNTPLSDLYKNTNIKNIWDNQFGTGVTSGFQDVYNQQAAASPSATFNIPTDLFPSTVSKSCGGSSSSSHSGINWDQDVAKSLIQDIIASGKDARSTANNLDTVLQDQYANTMRQAMQPQNFQGVLNALANRGMINSTTGENAMASAGQGVAQDIANKQFESQIAAADAKMQVPNILANLAALANETNSSGSSSNSGSTVTQNPLAPYELMTKLLIA